MRNGIAVACTLAFIICATTSHARTIKEQSRVPVRASEGQRNLDVTQRVFASQTPLDTTYLGIWGFDSGVGTCDDQGWTSVDMTTQTGDFWHVDDFAGLGGGSFGRLISLEGTQSMWCGARPSTTDPLLCSYANLPGYGSNWNQAFCTVSCLSVVGNINFDYLISYDSEPGYDEVYIQFDNCDDQWVTKRQFSGWQEPIFHTDSLTSAEHSGSARARVLFRSDGAWCDEDGLWDTDGAVMIDSLTVSDASGTVLPTELLNRKPSVRMERLPETGRHATNLVSAITQRYFRASFLSRKINAAQTCRACGPS